MRKLVAILYADVVGYSRLMGQDETGTHQTLRQYLDAIAETVSIHQGRVVNYSGDAVLADFTTVTEALSAAVVIQEDLRRRNQESTIAEDRKIWFRIGVHLGEVIVDGVDIYGDGVNVAARLEGLAEPGGICVSEAVRSAVGTRLAFGFAFMGEREVKNIAEPIRAYRVVAGGEAADGAPPCPYPGMVPFGATDARHFYGRDEEVARMVQLLRRQRFMMVIGPSGSGKSSLVYAGLLPELEQSRYFNRNYWLIRTMRPGSHPTDVLAGIIGQGDPGEGLNPDTVDALLKAHQPAQRLLLLVDQFEEVFTQADRPEQARFIAALQAFRLPENCALILTLRADFYPDLMTSYLWPVDASQRVEVAPLRGQALRQAIERPAADVGVRIDGALVDQLLADAADEPGALPLLQETMGLIWDDIEHHRLPVSAYQRLSSTVGQGDEALNGLAVAIAMKADATLTELDRGQQAIARRIFLRLIQFGEGRADTRRQQPVASLRAANDGEGAFERTLEHLTANRLLTRSGGDGAHPPAVDISHEALIAGWSRLQEWADERREAEQIRRRLDGKAAEWVRLGKGTGGLLDEAELPEAERWLTSADAADLGFDATLHELVEVSSQVIAEAERVREDGRQRELAQAQALAAEQATAAKRMRRSLVGLATVLAVAVAAGTLAWTQRQKAQFLASQEAAAREQAEVQRGQAQNARLSSIAQLLAIQAPAQQAISLDERGALMSRQAYLFGAGGSRRLQEQIDGVLREVAGKPYFSKILEPLDANAIAFSPDGTWLASAHIDPSKVQLHDLTRPGAEPRQLTGYPAHLMVPGTSVPSARLVALAFSPDGKALIAANADGSIGRWDLDDPQAPLVELPLMKNGLWSAAYSPDGRWLAVGGKADDVFAWWDLTRADAKPTLISDPEPAIAGSGPPPASLGGVPVAFSADSATLATGSLNGVIRLWHSGDMTKPFVSLYGHEGSLLALAFYDDGKRLVSSGQDSSIRLWDLQAPSDAPVVLNSGASAAVSLDVDAAGELMASSKLADAVSIWRISEPEQPPIVLASGGVHQVKFSPDGQYLASAGTTSFLRLWDLQPSGETLTLTGHQAPVEALALSPDMQLLASGGDTGDGTIRLWRWDDLDAEPILIAAHDGDVNGLDFSNDGRQLLSASWDDDAVQLWDIETSPPSFTTLNFPEATEPWTALFSPDGETVAASGAGGVFTLPLGEPGAEPDTLVSVDIWTPGMAYSSQGDTLAAASIGPGIFLKDLNRPDEPAFELRSDSKDGTWSVDFSPDGARLASGGKDGTVRLWNPGAPNAPSVLLGRHDATVRRVLFSPDGRLLASGGHDHSVRLWNMDNLEALPVILPGHDGDVRSLAFSADGKYLVTGGADNAVRIWYLANPLNSSPTQDIADMLCQKVRRNLAFDEWQKFVGDEIPYERTCPNLPIHPSVFETAGMLVKENDIEGATALLTRAADLDPSLNLNPQEEVERLAKSGEQ